jgi:hypothetical protein
MAGIAFDDLIPDSDTVGAPGISVSQLTDPGESSHPLFADLIPSSGNLPSSPTAGASPPSALPTPDDDGRSFELRSPARSTPDAPTWLGRRVQDIQGKQDPLYSDVPSVFSQNKDVLQAPTGSAAMLGATDEQMRDVMKKQLGNRFISTFKDANGYDLIRFADADGQPQLGYVNKPGLDSEDVVRGVKGALPYAAAGEILGPLIGGYSLLTRALASGGTGATLSAGGDKLMQPLGNEQGVDMAKAASMAMLGPLGEGAAALGSSLWTKFVTIPKYFDKSTGQLTPLGKQAARSMGLDPDQMASDAMSTFGKTYAMNPADAQSKVDGGTFDFNIPATRGQVAKDPQQLLQEKSMRSGLYGLDAKNQIEDLDRRQADAIATAVRDTIPSRLAGQRWQGGEAPEVYGNNIGMNLSDARANAKGAERDAWRQTGPLTAKTEVSSAPNTMTPMTGVDTPTSAMQGTDLLKDTLRDNLGDFANVLSPENTPTTFKMWSYLNDFMAGRKPSSSLHDSLGLVGSRDIDSVRRALGLMQKDAQTATDQETAKAVYRSFNDWIDKAASKQMLAGDPVAAANLKAARDVSREMNSIFKPQGATGRLTPGGQLLEKIAQNADTPERIVHALIPSPNTEIPAGTIEALGLIRRGMQKYGPAGADGQVWNSIKMAYLSKLTQGRGGEFLSPHMMSQNLRKAMTAQKTLFETIYAPADRAVIGRFVRQLDKVNWKDPNPSGTATGVASLAKQMFGKLLDAFGPLGQAAWEFSGVQHAWGTSVAKQAVKQAPLVLPSVPVTTLALRFGNALAAPAIINNSLAVPDRRSR